MQTQMTKIKYSVYQKHHQAFQGLTLAVLLLAITCSILFWVSGTPLVRCALYLKACTKKLNEAIATNFTLFTLLCFSSSCLLQFLNFSGCLRYSQFFRCLVIMQLKHWTKKHKTGNSLASHLTWFLLSVKPTDIWAKISFPLHRWFLMNTYTDTKKLKTMWTVYLHPIRSTTDLNLLAPKDCPGQNSTARVCFAIQSNANQDTAHANIMFNNSTTCFSCNLGTL